MRLRWASASACSWVRSTEPITSPPTSDGTHDRRAFWPRRARRPAAARRSARLLVGAAEPDGEARIRRAESTSCCANARRRVERASPPRAGSGCCCGSARRSRVARERALEMPLDEGVRLGLGLGHLQVSRRTRAVEDVVAGPGRAAGAAARWRSARASGALPASRRTRRSGARSSHGSAQAGTVGRRPPRHERSSELVVPLAEARHQLAANGVGLGADVGRPLRARMIASLALPAQRSASRSCSAIAEALAPFRPRRARAVGSRPALRRPRRTTPGSWDSGSAA